MTNEKKNIVFCVETKTLDDDKIKQLHKWCLDAGAIEDESVADWLGDYEGFDFAGINYAKVTYVLDNEGSYNNNIIKYEDVPAFLGLETPFDEEEIPYSSKSKTTVEDLKDLREPEAKPLTIADLQQLRKDCNILSIEICEDNIVVYHDSTERNYIVKDEEELVELCNVLKMLDKFEYQEG